MMFIRDNSLSGILTTDISYTIVNFENFSGAYSGKATPVPIPNTAVKLTCVDDTWLETAWKSR
jgi:hypothetical protein